MLVSAQPAKCSIGFGLALQIQQTLRHDRDERDQPEQHRMSVVIMRLCGHFLGTISASILAMLTSSY